MLSSISKTTAALLAVGIPLAYADDTLHFPSTVTAGTPMTLTINHEINPITEAGDTLFRISLLISPPGTLPLSLGTYSPQCLLVNLTSMDMTTLSITILADIGPSGSFYALVSTDINLGGGSSFAGYINYGTDSAFSLQGGTGKWSPAELSGVSFSNDNRVPCTAYSCVRNCTLTTKVKSDQFYECMGGCPGVYIPSAALSDGSVPISTETISGTVIVEMGPSSALPSGSTTPSRTPAAVSANPTAAASSTPSTSISGSISGGSNTTSPTQHPNAASQIAAGIPIILSLVAGILLM
ncbi:hypothetical protein F5884DRAFT_832285 [Xylogone sp. PMI_703]|nr:hypothetical protein F5884DRAFT_832285 [Xylogone sp. PMI_703]